MKLDPVWTLEMAAARPAHASATARRLAIALVLSLLAWVLTTYGETVASIVAIWERSDTFAHGFLIVPISAWLIWQQRRALAALDMRPDLLSLPLLIVPGFAWLLGDLADVDVVQQYAVAIMIPLAVRIVLGRRVAGTIAFPMLFLLLAVPFGEFLVPPLMEHTANFTVLALRLTGIPVYREGLHFTIPSGTWSIVEACSGLRYLIASITVGVLFAYLTYRSWRRRLLFVAASFVVPVIANWLRAYMIVMIGHLSSMQYAVGVDHLVYGWVFFGLVMALLFWVGSFWREDVAPPAGDAVPPPVHVRQGGVALGPIAIAAVAASALLAIWPALAARLEAAGSHGLPVLALPAAAGGWQPDERPLADWQPRFVNPAAAAAKVYIHDGARVGLYVGYYRNQRVGAELITSQNVLVSRTDRDWAIVSETQRGLKAFGGPPAVAETVLRGGAVRVLVWHWYWVDGQYVIDPYWAKLLQAKSRLFGGGDDSAVVAVYAPYDGPASSPEKSMQSFVGAMQPAISVVLENARRGKPLP